MPTAALLVPADGDGDLRWNSVGEGRPHDVRAGQGRILLVRLRLEQDRMFFRLGVDQYDLLLLICHDVVCS